MDEPINQLPGLVPVSPQPSSGGRWLVIVLVIVLLVLIGAGIFYYLKGRSVTNSQSTATSQGGTVANLTGSQPSLEPATAPKTTTVSQSSTDTDVQAVDTDLNALDTNLSNVESGLNDQSGDLRS